MKYKGIRVDGICHLAKWEKNPHERFSIETIILPYEPSIALVNVMLITNCNTTGRYRMTLVILASKQSNSSTCWLIDRHCYHDQGIAANSDTKKSRRRPRHTQQRRLQNAIWHIKNQRLVCPRNTQKHSP